MNHQSHLLVLKAKLQTLGALRPEAWVKIVELMRLDEMKPGERFIRKAGLFAYVADGLLKEYDTEHRRLPIITNFISSNQVVITRDFNKTHHLIAAIPSAVLFWTFEDLEILYNEYKELKTIYDTLCATYDANNALGRLIMAERSAKKRVQLLIENHKSSLAFLSKKDLSNYLGLNYDHFTLVFSELIRR